MILPFSRFITEATHCKLQGHNCRAVYRIESKKVESYDSISQERAERLSIDIYTHFYIDIIGHFFAEVQKHCQALAVENYEPVTLIVVGVAFDTKFRSISEFVSLSMSTWLPVQ